MCRKKILDKEDTLFSENMIDLSDSAGAGTYSIIGADNRTKVNNTSLFPYRVIARLEITRENGTKTYASGSLIGDRIFATAGHVIVQDGKMITVKRILCWDNR